MLKGRVVALVSGGMDSATLVYWLRHEGREVFALGFNYGQRHSRELGFGRRLCLGVRVPWEVAELQGIGHLLLGSALTSPDVPVPEGHYEDESMRATVVANRNMIFLAIATAWAITIDAEAVAYAAHAGDHAIYPDCRQEFIDAMGTAMGLCDYEQRELLTPFVSLSKAEIVTIGKGLGVDYARTWSCYKGGHVHCGKCGTCVERKEAFIEAGISDPTEYEPC